MHPAAKRQQVVLVLDADVMLADGARCRYGRPLGLWTVLVVAVGAYWHVRDRQRRELGGDDFYVAKRDLKGDKVGAGAAEDLVSELLEWPWS